MSTWQAVFRRAKDVAYIHQVGGRATVRYENAHGTPIDGWYLCTLGTTGDETEYYAGTDYKDVFSHHCLILGNDGTLYAFTLLNVEKGIRESGGFRVVTDRTPSVYPVYPEMLHPVELRRFRTDDVMATLNRLATKTNSDPEHTAPDTNGTETFSKNTVNLAPVQVGGSYPQPVRRAPSQDRTDRATEKSEEDYTPWWVTLLLFIGPFIFLAALALILYIFCGARLN